MSVLQTSHTTATLLEASKLDAALDPGIQALWPGARLAGPAFPVQGVGGDNLALHNAVLAAPPGSILVVDVGGKDFGHWGEILAVAAMAREISGLVIDGAVRDSVEQEALGFPVFSRGTAIRGTAKAFPGWIGRPVRVGGVLVRPGDLVVGDADGVVSLPHAQTADILERAGERVRHEESIIAALRNGASTIDLYGLDPAGRQS
ncbi:RraA family protein [Sinomonas humi]|uniref:Putative 4-hydroxy-4-methyl-2-oxoglutarate aldolase n=1 Tax=Sinomonas humi TaxID=1338436 RepID=A0A0B2ACY7_9MICC|nr:RraA family protein [Sinomonas humi]KHL01414.1 dimethylmenaquinone methyltransferase [Sinomonas humi]